MNEIRRGEIFYIARGGASCGSEQYADRPAVVVSNDENNKHSGIIEYYRNKIQAMQQSLEEKKSEKPQEAAGETSEIVVRLETERDTYKALYEQLFERLLTMGGTGN